MSDEFGLTLREAVEQYIDRNKRRALLEVDQPPFERESRFNDLFAFEGAETERANDAWRERRARAAAKAQAKREVGTELKERIRSGELIATGILCPPTLDSTRRPIPPVLIPILNPHFGKSSFIGPSIEIIEVRLQRACDLRLASKTHVPETPGPASIPSVLASLMETPVIRPRGSPGRPGLPPEYRKELFRRAEAGQMHNSLNQEARSLQAWGAGCGLGQPNGEPWAESTIRNHLRVPYRELSTRKTGPE